MQYLIPGSKGLIKWNNNQVKLTTKSYNQYFYFLIDLSFQEVNKRFVLSFTNGDDRTGIYFIPTMEIKVYDVVIDGRKSFDQSLKSKILENMLLVKIRIIELIVFQIMHISNKFIS